MKTPIIHSQHSLPFSSIKKVCTISSTASEEEPRKAKAKLPNILSINFRSIWGEKEIFTKMFYRSKTDTELCTETLLDPSIKDCELLHIQEHSNM